MTHIKIYKKRVKLRETRTSCLAHTCEFLEQTLQLLDSFDELLSRRHFSLQIQSWKMYRTSRAVRNILPLTPLVNTGEY